MNRKKEGLCAPRWVLVPALMLLLAGRSTSSEPPEQLLCVNPECTGVISTATTLTKYSNPESFLLPFNANVKVRVLAKPKDPKEDYWGVELNGQYGFVPKKLIKENSIHAQAKKTVDVKNFISLAEKLNRDNKASKTKPPIEEENEDDFENDEPETVINDPTKSPSPKNIKTEQYYKDKYMEKERRYRKRHTENLEITSTTEDPIISSALPNSNTNINDIHATQSVTVIEGTTFYSDSIDTTEISVEKESSDSRVEKDTFESEKEEMPITPYSITDEVDVISEISQNLPKEIENKDEKSLSDSRENVIEDLSNKSLDMLSSDKLSQTIHDKNLENTDNELPKINSDVLPEIDTKEITLSNIEDPPSILATIENQNDVSLENISTDNANILSNENINVEDVQKSSSIEAEKVIKEEAEEKYDLRNETSDHIENSNSNPNIKILDDAKKTFDHDPNTSEETDINSRIEESKSNLENDAIVENLNTDNDHADDDLADNDHADDDHAVNDHADDDHADDDHAGDDHADDDHADDDHAGDDHADDDHADDSKIEIKSENIELVQDFSNSENYSTIDETLKINETVDDGLLNIENIIDSENSINTETPLSEIPSLSATSQTPSDEPNIEEKNINDESSDFQNVQSESVTMKYNEVFNDNEPQLPLDVESTTTTQSDFSNNYEPQSTHDIHSDTENSDIFNSKKEVNSINMINKLPVNHEKKYNNDILPSDLLDSNIENERPFILNPVALLDDLFKSLSNIKKYSTESSNTEEVLLNDHRQSENSDHYMLTETSECSAEDGLEKKSSPIKPPNFTSYTPLPDDMMIWLTISSLSILMFSLGYYYLENKKQDGRLLSLVNTLQKELLCSSKECALLKEELTITKDKLMGIEDSSFGSNEMVICLKKELADNQLTISELQDKLISTEEELANSTEAALELQSILDEQLSAKDTSSSSLAFTITNLQSQLDDQQTTMNLTKAQLASKIEENELLLLKIMDVNNKCTSIEKRLSNTQDSLQQAIEENNSKSQQLQQLASNLEKSLLQAETQKKIEVKELQLQIKDLKDELNANKSSLKARNHELQTLQENVKILQIDENHIRTILEDSHTKAELVKITSEKTSLLEKFEAETIHTKELNKLIDEQNSMLSEIKEKLGEADQKTLEATTRLEVLTNYFNQKEADLLKELSTKESLWMSQQGEAMSTVEKIQALQQEIQQHKDTAESIRREVVEQEAAWRAKVAALEQRAHEHWLARRAAERSAEASAREAQTLRQRLAAPSPDKRVVSPLTTGENLPDPSFLPPLGMLPPPPLGFLPPPLGGPMLLPPPLPPHRPPPLGRLSSPPPLQSMRPDRSYSPDSRYSPERAYSPQNRGRSPFSNSESRRRTYNNNRRYDNRYYDSEEDRRSRRYETETDFSPVNTLPPSPIPNSRPLKSASKFENSDYSQ